MTVERRKHHRIKLAQPATVLRRDGSPVADCMLRDISIGGARLQFDAAAELPRVLCLRMPRGGRVERHCEIVWQLENEVGVRFVSPEPLAEQAAIDQRAATPDITLL